MKHVSPYGFSLIEVIVVLAILGIIAGVTLPAYRDLTRHGELVEAAQQVESLLTRSREASLRTGMDVRIQMDPSARRFWVQVDSAGVRQDLETGKLPIPASVIWGPDTPRLTWMFHGTGLVDSPTMVLSLNGSSVTIDIDRWTGETTTLRAGDIQ